MTLDPREASRAERKTMDRRQFCVSSSAAVAAGVTHPGTHALTVKYQGVKPGVLLEWKDLPVDTVKFVVRHGISVMPQFRKTEISDQELDALAKYLSRNTLSK
jgi:(+)-pinoresinol hydroxylase